MRDRTGNGELINRFLGDKRNYSKLHAMCIRVFRNHEAAEDALHEIYIKLCTNALTIDFPENDEEAFLYMHQVIYNYHRDMLDIWKHAPAKGEEPDMLAEEVDEEVPHSMKLEGINLYIQLNSRLFTAEQLKLWECISTYRTITETEIILGKTRQAIAKLRYKLFAKIRRLIGLHD